MYLQIDKNNYVCEVIPDFDSAFPDIHISKRFPSDFVASLIHVNDGNDIKQGFYYDRVTGKFYSPENMPMSADAKISALEKENAELKSYIETIENALCELDMGGAV